MRDSAARHACWPAWAAPCAVQGGALGSRGFSAAAAGLLLPPLRAGRLGSSLMPAQLALWPPHVCGQRAACRRLVAWLARHHHLVAGHQPGFRWGQAVISVGRHHQTCSS